MPPKAARGEPGGCCVRCNFHTVGYTEARFPSIHPQVLIPERSERNQARAFVAEFVESADHGLRDEGGNHAAHVASQRSDFAHG